MSFANKQSTYNGDALVGYILKGLIGGETLSTSGVSIESNIKYKRTLKKLASQNIVQIGTCNFSATSGLTITENYLEPKTIKINEEFCYDEFDTLWEGTANGQNSPAIPTETANAITDEFIAQMASDVEKMVWQGDTAGATGTVLDLIDGYEKILAVTGATGSVKVSGTTLTKSNIVTELDKVYAAIPDGVKRKGKDKLVIFVSYTAATLYEQNLQAQGVNTTADGGVLRIYGIEIKPVGGLSDVNTIVAGERANFYVGTDLQSDFNSIMLLDQYAVTGDYSLRFIARAKLDVAIAWPHEVVFYS
jgi:hypothetical protein